MSTDNPDFSPPWLVFPHAGLGDICSTRQDGAVLAQNLPLDEARALVLVSDLAARGLTKVVAADRARIRVLEARCAQLRGALEATLDTARDPGVVALIEATLQTPGEALLDRLREAEALNQSLAEELTKLGGECDRLKREINDLHDANRRL